jgi:two-component system LytT family response regulator
MKQLPDNQFVRIHRSYAIAIKYVTSYNQSEVEIAKQKLPIGMSYKDAISGLF